ncbi:MAG TPA: hypothetical protein VJZ76_02520 [Thermoanaerobaculia bacterium]|nr:hypothetical protein [Thermoanaerobaculia bacterium]
MEDTARVVVTVLIAAFVIERITAALMFFSETPKGPERTRKIYRILIAAILGAVAVWLAHIRLLSRLSTAAPDWLDAALSWLVLVGGADRIRDFVAPGGGGGGGEKKQELPPIQFTIEEKDGTTTVQQFHAS